MAPPRKVDQSRVNCHSLAVMARYQVTQGAWCRVPISGVAGPVLTGQATCRASLSPGADGSEPRRPPGRHDACRAPCVHRYGGRQCARCTQGDRVCQGQCRVRALTRCGRVHIRVYLTVRPGQGRGENGAKTVPEPVPGQCQDSAISAPDTRHPTVRHPTSRHPTSVPTTCNVPRVYCYSVLALRVSPLAISDLCQSYSMTPCSSHASAIRGYITLVLLLLYVSRYPWAPQGHCGYTINNLLYTLLRISAIIDPRPS